MLKLKKRKIFIFIVFLCVDLFLLYCATKFSFYLRFSVYENIQADIWKLTEWRKYYQFFNYFALLYIIILHYFGFYKIRRIYKSKLDLRYIFYACVTYIVLIFFISYYLKFVTISRLYYFFYFFTLLIFNYLRFLLQKIIVFVMTKSSFFYTNIILVGIDDLIFPKIKAELTRKSGFNLLGYFDDIDRNNGLQYFGDINEFKKKLADFDNINVVIALPPEKKNDTLNIINICSTNNIDVFLLPNYDIFQSTYINIDEIESIPLLKL